MEDKMKCENICTFKHLYVSSCKIFSLALSYFTPSFSYADFLSRFKKLFRTGMDLI